VNLNRAVFLDRDGTLIEERDYLSRAADVALFSGAGDALRSLQIGGFKLFIVSNQSGVGRGYFTLEDVACVNERMIGLFAVCGVRFEKIYIAPEAPGQPSRGRKPSPQFLLDARDEFGLDLSASYMIGDKWIDLECGWNAGVKKSILVRTGYGKKAAAEYAGRLEKALVVDDLGAAARWILETK
jgi:D-glycero-D-manno-heptose 1,7-bisphosphate phosphatase